MFKFFKKEKSIRDKVFESVEGKLRTPYYFKDSYMPSLCVNPDKTYNIYYKVSKMFSEDVHNLNLSIDNVHYGTLTIHLILQKKTFIDLKEDVLEFLRSIEEYFEVTPYCIIIDGEKRVELLLSDMNEINNFLEKSNKIIFVTKKWIKNQEPITLLETLGKMAIYEKYKYYNLYNELLILSDEVLTEDRLEELHDCLDINLPISELEEVLLEKQFELLEVF